MEIATISEANTLTSSLKYSSTILHSINNSYFSSQDISLICREVASCCLTLTEENLSDTIALFNDCGVLDDDLLLEIDAFGWECVESLTEDLKQLTLKFDICREMEEFEHLSELEDGKFILHLTVRKEKQISIKSCDDNVLKAASHDSPKIFESSDNCRTLTEIFEEFRAFVLPFAQMWTSFVDLDTKYWVLEPECPKLIHCFRRILMRSRVSILIVFDYLNPSNLPVLSFTGPQVKVSDLKRSLNQNWELWDSSADVITNLCNVLNIEKGEFLKQPEQNTSFLDQSNLRFADNFENEVLADIKCQICFDVHYNDNKDEESDYYDEDEEEQSISTPDVACENAACSKQFHSRCLSKWFLSLPFVKRVFETMFGPCPLCKSKIGINLS